MQKLTHYLFVVLRDCKIFCCLKAGVDVTRSLRKNIVKSVCLRNRFCKSMSFVSEFDTEDLLRQKTH